MEYYIEVEYEAYPEGSELIYKRSYKSNISVYPQVWKIKKVSETRIKRRHRQMHPYSGPVVSYRLLSAEEALKYKQ